MTARALITAALAGLFAAACQTGSAMTPATLRDADDTSLARLKETLSEAMGRASIKLAGGDLTERTSVSVLPPPLGPNETNSPAMPEVFDILTNGTDCFVTRRETGETYKLDGVSCVAVEG